jgi:glycine/D-amino acid oxidase-like deaminating enzyme
VPSHAQVSYWLETAGDLTPRPALDGSVDADVAVLGAGFTGLWTAWYLLQREPSLRVVLCEAEIAGYGASGRNGAWCSAGLGVTPGELARRYGREVARRTVEALRDTVVEVGEVARTQGLDAHYRRTGLLRVARGPHELPAVEAAWRTLDGLGLADGCAVLDRAALARRLRIGRADGAFFDPHCATLHPGRLVRGLARRVEEAGATVVERTPVTRVERGRLVTRRGHVRAPVVVLAGEAYLCRLPSRRRSLLPLYSLIVLTDPLSAEQAEAIGWEGGECLSSHRYTVDYLSRTPDGRVLFGGRGAPYHFASRIAPAYDHHGPTHRLLRAQLRDWFPALAGIRFSHAWGGPIGMPRDWLPTIHHDPRSGLAGAYGYTGQGVATANLAGRTLADLILGTPSALTELPMVGHRSRRWEPEPLRWLATRYLQRSLARIDERARRTGRPPTGRSLPERLIRH